MNVDEELLFEYYYEDVMKLYKSYFEYKPRVKE